MIFHQLTSYTLDTVLRPYGNTETETRHILRLGRIPIQKQYKTENKYKDRDFWQIAKRAFEGVCRDNYISPIAIVPVGRAEIADQFSNPAMEALA